MTQGEMTLEELSQMYAFVTLQRLNGNKRETAKVLGISRATLYRLLADRERRLNLVRQSASQRVER